MIARSLLCTCILLAGCASTPPVRPVVAKAQAAAAAECRDDAGRAHSDSGPGFAARAAQATKTASQVLVGGGPHNEQKVGWALLTAPIALAAGVTAAAVGSGLNSAGNKLALERAVADCLQGRQAGAEAASAGGPKRPVAHAPPRNGAAELRALGVETPG